MNDQRIINLENFIFTNVNMEDVAANTIADIIGVLIDIKPAMIGGFTASEYEKIDTDKFVRLLDTLNLKVLLFNHPYMLSNKMEREEIFCISKSIDLSKQLHDAFTDLWATMDDYGKVFAMENWEDATKRIGELLGYPDTAIDYFIKEKNLNDEKRIACMRRNRYYVHNPMFEEREFEAYDRKLNQAISEYAPKTTDYFTENQKKRWLE